MTYYVVSSPLVFKDPVRLCNTIGWCFLTAAPIFWNMIIVCLLRSHQNHLLFSCRILEDVNFDTILNQEEYNFPLLINVIHPYCAKTLCKLWDPLFVKTGFLDCYNLTFHNMKRTTGQHWRWWYQVLFYNALVLHNIYPSWGKYFSLTKISISGSVLRDYS